MEKVDTKKENSNELSERLNIMQNPDNYLRIAVVGNVDSGKSTLVGILTKGLLDNGRGSSRSKVFNHPHESKTGRTSSIAQEIMGFDKNGKQIFPERFTQKKNKYWAEVCKESQKMITLVDLCGHEKYLKTTMLGMIGLVPDYVLIVVGGNLGLSRMTKEHLGIAIALEIPFFIVITKTDMVEEEILKNTIHEISQLLKTKNVNKKPIIVEYDEKIDKTLISKIIKDVPDKENEPIERKTNVNEDLTEKEDKEIAKLVDLMKSNVICPIFRISSIINFGLKQLNRFIYTLKSRSKEIPGLGKHTDPVEFDIHDKFTVVGTGLVVSGLLKSGTISINGNYLLGPDKDNQYKKVTVKSIHFSRMPVHQVYSGFFCTLSLKSIKKKELIDNKAIRKGAVLLDSSIQPKAIWSFDAKINVLHHSTTIVEGYESVMHCGVIRQSVRIVKMQKELLRTGDRDILKFMFLYNTEYLKENSVFLLREGRTKIWGVVTKVYETKEDLNKK
jgi:GTPase